MGYSAYRVDDIGNIVDDIGSIGDDIGSIVDDTSVALGVYWSQFGMIDCVISIID